MHQIKSNRIQTLDLLKGLVMVIMALDHTRDYFHYGSFFFDPTDPETTDLALFFTRWITHYCAPAFSFLAGVSAFLVGRRKTGKELSSFLLTRGLWLVFIEFTIVAFGWSFNIHFNGIGLLVIWSLGISMIFLAAMIHLPLKYILVLSLIIIFGHNLLDNIHFENNFLWAVLHERSFFPITDTITIRVIYPLLPWIGVMSLGYYFGSFYDKSVETAKRQKLFTLLGISAIVLFVIIRGINIYGDPRPWTGFPTIIQSMYSFMDPTKYPPSLSYLLMTLGPTLLLMGTTENLKGKIVDFFSVFGRVPFFYYFLHIYMIHLFAIILAQLSGFGWQVMILDGFVSKQEQLKGFGVDLWITYLIWIGIILLLYPLCRKFSNYKLANKDKAWLSYF